MPELAALAALFVSAFTSATLLPGSSEAVLLGLLAGGIASPVALVAVAATGNILGSVVNLALGLYIVRFRHKRWFPVGPDAMARAERWYRRWEIGRAHV
jgi:membrane protein YqaA with SNARE-associated domain